VPSCSREWKKGGEKSIRQHPHHSQLIFPLSLKKGTEIGERLHAARPSLPFISYHGRHTGRRKKGKEEKRKTRAASTTIERKSASHQPSASSSRGGKKKKKRQRGGVASFLFYRVRDSLEKAITRPSRGGKEGRKEEDGASSTC